MAPALASAQGGTKKEAEQSAARKALVFIRSLRTMPLAAT